MRRRARAVRGRIWRRKFSWDVRSWVGRAVSDPPVILGDWLCLGLDRARPTGSLRWHRPALSRRRRRRGGAWGHGRAGGRSATISIARVAALPDRRPRESSASETWPRHMANSWEKRKV